MVASGAPTSKNIIDADAAKKAKGLLDIISLAETAAVALERIKIKFLAENTPTAGDVRDFDDIITSLKLVTKAGRHQTAKVSPVAHLLRAYDMRSAGDNAKFVLENPMPKSFSEEMWKLKCFMRGSPRHTAKCSSKIPMKRQSERKIILKDNRDKVVECATIREILNRNTAVEAKLRTCAVNEDHADLASLTVHQFLTLNSSQLQDFVHARKFVGKTFEKSKLVGADGKLNKTRYKTQTAESIEKDCSEEEPCLVWHAWRLRSQALVLKPREEPDLNTSFQAPKFSVVYARPAVAKKPSEYLKSQPWVDSLKSVVKGVGAVAITNELMDNADSLALALEPRLDLHIDDRVDLSRQDHFTLRFTRDNLSSMAAAMCLVGHVVSHVDTYRLDERLLALPIHANFGMITGDLAELEGCYLYFDPQKYKWIRSGKTSGDGKDACFRGRGKKHLENAKSKDSLSYFA